MASGLEFHHLAATHGTREPPQRQLGYEKIPGDSPLASVLIFLYNDVTPVYRRSKWVTMDEVLKHDSVYDGVTFMKRLKLLLERNMYRLFYKHGSESEYTLRRTKWQGGRDTGIRGYPLFNWNEKEDVLKSIGLAPTMTIN